MSEIQDEAYTEAMLEIERLKRINAQERATITELADLVDRLADSLQARTTEGESFPYDLNAQMLNEPARILLADYRRLITEARAEIWR